MCKISVVTSVYNCEKYIGETIESVQNQSFEDWEFILLNDCSKDRSGEIIEEYAAKDSRIKYCNNPKNLGQVKSLNYGISIAQGDYIARLDHDDLCLPDRFEKQLAYMESHPNCVLVGSRMKYWEKGRIFDSEKYDGSIIEPPQCKFMLLEDSIIPHSSFFIRKKTLQDNKISYREEYRYSEDYGLIADLYGLGDIALINDSLIIYRLFPEQLSNTCSDDVKQEERERARLEIYEKLNVTDKDISRKYITKKMMSNQEIKEFADFIYRYASFCGLGDDRSEIKKMNCVRELYFHGCRDQNPNLSILCGYATSSLRTPGWLYTRSGLSFLLHSILKTNKSLTNK